MLTKALGLSQARLLCPTKRYLSSQLAQTNQQLAKTDDRKHDLVELTAKRDTLTESQRKELSKLIKSPVEMDVYFETRLKEVPLVRKKAFWDAKGGFSVDFLGDLHRKWDVSWGGIKRRIRWYINYREMYNQRYIARRHAILGESVWNKRLIYSITWLALQVLNWPALTS